MAVVTLALHLAVGFVCARFLPWPYALVVEAAAIIAGVVGMGVR